MITEASTETLNELLNLWGDYQGFYKVKEINREKNTGFINGIINNPLAGKIHVIAGLDGQLIGFSTLYFTYASTVAEPVAVLNDLFIEESQRGKGFGKALLDHVIDYAGSQGFANLRWMTQASNASAQKLYSYYAEPNEWLLYAVKTGKLS